MTVTYNSSSPYHNTQQTNVYLPYLDFWNGPYLSGSSLDSIITLTNRYHLRPDLLSYDLYKTPNWWWIFSIRNPDLIQDPIFDFVSGLTIYAPDISTLPATTNNIGTNY